MQRYTCIRASPDEVGLVFGQKGQLSSSAIVLNRWTALEMARDILRQVDPTIEDRILECLESSTRSFLKINDLSHYVSFVLIFKMIGSVIYSDLVRYLSD